MKKNIVRDIETHLHPRDYNEHEVCRIVNWKQAKMYIKHNVYPIDMYTSVGKNDEDVLVFIFLIAETKDLFQAWKNYELG